MFESVSILFSDVVTFTEICSRITPMEVVSMLNGMYSIFDTLTERNKVYKVGICCLFVGGQPKIMSKFVTVQKIFLTFLTLFKCKMCFNLCACSTILTILNLYLTKQPRV